MTGQVGWISRRSSKRLIKQKKRSKECVIFAMVVVYTAVEEEKEDKSMVRKATHSQRDKITPFHRNQVTRRVR